MNSWRLAQVTTALCGTVGLAGWVVASYWLRFGRHRKRRRSANRGPPPTISHRQGRGRTASNRIGRHFVASADAATVAELVTGMAAWPNRSQVLPPEISPGQVATADTPDPVLKDAREPSADREDPRQEGQRNPATSPALMDGSMEAGPRDRILGTVV